MGYWQINSHKRKYYDPIFKVWKSDGSVYVPTKKPQPPSEPEEEPIPPEPPIPRQTIVSSSNTNNQGSETRDWCQNIYPFYGLDGTTPDPVDAWNSLIVLAASYPSGNVNDVWSDPTWQLFVEEPEGSGTYVPGIETTSKTSAELFVTQSPYMTIVKGPQTWKLGTTTPSAYDWLYYTSEIGGFTNTVFTDTNNPALLLNLPAIDAGTRVYRYKIRLTNVYTLNGTLYGPIISEWPLCVHPTTRPPGAVPTTNDINNTSFVYETTSGTLFTNTTLANGNYDAPDAPNPNGGSTVRFPLPRPDTFYQHDVPYNETTHQYVWRLPELDDFFEQVWHVLDTTTRVYKYTGTVPGQEKPPDEETIIQNKPHPLNEDEILLTQRWDSGSYATTWDSYSRIAYVHSYWLENNQGKYARFRVIVTFDKLAYEPPALDPDPPLSYDPTLIKQFGPTNSLQNQPLFLDQQSWNGVSSYWSNGTRMKQNADGTITIYRGADPADIIPEICLVGYIAPGGQAANTWNMPKLFSTVNGGIDVYKRHFYTCEPSISPTYTGPVFVADDELYTPQYWDGTSPAGHRTKNMWRDGEAPGLVIWKIRFDDMPTRDVLPGGITITGCQTWLPTNYSVVTYTPQAIWDTTDTPEPTWESGGRFDQDTETRKVSFILPLGCDPRFVWVKNRGRIVFWDPETPANQIANIYGGTSGGSSIGNCRVPQAAIQSVPNGYKFTISRLHPIQLKLDFISTIFAT